MPVRYGIFSAHHGSERVRALMDQQNAHSCEQQRIDPSHTSMLGEDTVEMRSCDGQE